MAKKPATAKARKPASETTGDNTNSEATAGVGQAPAVAQTGGAAYTPASTPEGETLSGAISVGGAAQSGKKAGRTRAVLVVASRRAEGRWRAGMHFTREPSVLNAADLTEEQIAAIEADSELVASREERPVE